MAALSFFFLVLSIYKINSCTNVEIVSVRLADSQWIENFQETLFFCIVYQTPQYVNFKLNHMYAYFILFYFFFTSVAFFQVAYS